MPELPEVHTTVAKLNTILPGQTITDLWSDLHINSTKKESKTLKSSTYLRHFKHAVIGQTITAVTRRGKNIIIALSSSSAILIHMKMTGHLLYGTYQYNAREKTWEAKDAGPLRDDSFNQHIHVVFSLDSGKHLAFSDMRKFGKITLLADAPLDDIGPDPLADGFSFEVFSGRLDRRPSARIKQVLMDQSVIAGIGNIYSDEMLWRAGIHPTSVTKNIPSKRRKKLYTALKEVLTRGIDLGGDSTSDYRTPDGTRGSFQATHRAYQKTGTPCQRRGCSGIIERIKVGGRSAHFCSKHQKTY